MKSRSPALNFISSPENFHDNAYRQLNCYNFPGRGGKNLARWAAMYVCQELGEHRLKAIAKAFKLRRYATVSTTISKLKKLMQEDHRLEKQVIRILLDLTP